jgi:hypothetical protein
MDAILPHAARARSFDEAVWAEDGSRLEVPGIFRELQALVHWKPPNIIDPLFQYVDKSLRTSRHYISMRQGILTTHLSKLPRPA